MRKGTFYKNCLHTRYNQTFPITCSLSEERALQMLQMHHTLHPVITSSKLADA
jgi:hypothetical protein